MESAIKQNVKWPIEKGLTKNKEHFPCCPSISELKHKLAGISVWDFWHDPVKMAEAEIGAYNRFKYDKVTIGPNTRGITEALGGTFIYPEDGCPYVETPFINDYKQLDEMTAMDAFSHPRMEPFTAEAEILSQKLGGVVELSAHIGGPFTIAANLRGIERFLRDCRKSPDEVFRLLRIIVDSQKSCIDWADQHNLWICMADPVSIPDLIGPKMYKEFVYPFTKELTDYAYEKTHKKVFLHMCGNTYGIWEYFKEYQLSALSLDNVIDLERAIEELGDYFIITGNIDPVEIVLNGTKEMIFTAVKECIEIGKKSKHGFIIATGCDIPAATPVEHIEWFMEAGRE